MSEHSEAMRAIDELGAAVTEFKTTNDEVLDKKANAEAVAELEEKLEKIGTAVHNAEQKKRAIETEIEAQRARIEELEALGMTGSQTVAKKYADEYKDAFLQWLFQPNSTHKAMVEQHQQKMAALPEFKRTEITAAASGGSWLPIEIRQEIEIQERKISPVRQLINVRQILTNDYREVVDTGGEASGWVAETDARSDTATPSIRQIAPTMGELYALPQATEWALQDLINVEAWLTEKVSREFAFQEGQAVLTGNGTNRPTGIFNTAPNTTADESSPLRAAAAIEEIAAPSPNLLADHIYDLVYSVQTAYRMNGAFAMNSATVGAVRKAKDSNGAYVWQPSLQLGEPSTIAGFRFAVWEQMDDLGLSPQGHPVAFGDWNRGYLLVERAGIRVLQDPYSSPGFVRFYFRRREGGIVLNNDAIKVMDA